MSAVLQKHIFISNLVQTPWIYFSLDFNISKNSFIFKNDICGSWTAKQTLIWYNSKSTTLHPSIKCKFGTKCCWYCIRAVFTKTFYFFTKNWSFFEIAYIFKEIKPKWKTSDNLGQNISRIFHVLAQFLLTASKTVSTSRLTNFQTT